MKNRKNDTCAIETENEKKIKEILPRSGKKP